MIRIASNPNTRNCGNCGHFKKLPGERMRFCHNPEKISIRYESVEVDGDSPVKIPVCTGWLDCGLLERGLLKSTV